MINYKDLTCEQLQVLAVMAKFNCKGIRCEDCPLYTYGHGCGSLRAKNIIHDYEKESKQ